MIISTLPSCSLYKPPLPLLDACGLFKSLVGVVNAMVEQRHGGEEKLGRAGVGGIGSSRIDTTTGSAY
jgi:hypothetical protein